VLKRFFGPSVAVSLFCFLSTSLAYAGPSGSAGVEKVGSEVTTYLIWVLGPIVFLLGLVLAFYGWLMGDDRGIRRGLHTVIAGVLLFASPAIVEFVKAAVR
jgi:type IV secretory pathway VirB2 component (pilin)